MKRIAPVPQAWFTVVILALLYAMSFMDRMILSLLAAPVALDLKLSDPQLGVLLGAGFAVTYAVAGVPIAHLLDRSNRKIIICAGVTLWSLSTMAGAFASSFAVLAVTRGGVALGEAVMAPAAISIIADLFPRDRRGLPTTLFAAVPTFMTTASFAVGALIFGLVQHFGPEQGMAPWRVTLLIVGMPGLLLALVLAVMVREPTRVADQDRLVPEAADFRTFARYLWQHRALYLPFYIGASLLVMYVYGFLSWMPTLMIRGHGITTEQAGYLGGFNRSSQHQHHTA